MPADPPGPWGTLPWFLLTRPEPRAGSLPRERLSHDIDARLSAAPILLLTAPSGFGKTVALAQWARHRSDVAWLSVTDSADTAQLIRGALVPLLPPDVQRAVLSVAKDESAPKVHDVLRDLKEPVTLVIDDAHLLDPEVFRSMLGHSALLETGVLRLVLAGIPPLDEHFARERAMQQASVLTAADLAFTVEEVAEAIRGSVGESTADAAVLREHTGGWPIAIRLALLEGGSDLLAGDGTPERLLGDFIDRALLPSLRPPLADFIRSAAFCSRLDVDLAHALTGIDASEALLEECVRGGLFLDRYHDDDGRRMYRWHDAFASQVRAAVTAARPAHAMDLHRRAADALAGRYPTEAIVHALAARDHDRAAAVVRRSWLSILLDSHTATLDRLCLQLPAPVDPDILLIRACCRDLLGDPEGAALLRAQGLRGGGTGFVECFTELLLAPDTAAKAAAADQARIALENCGPGEDYLSALFLLGWAEVRLRRDPRRAAGLLRSARDEAAARGRGGLHALAQVNLTFALTYAGEFREAAAQLQELDASASDWDRFEGGIHGFSAGYTAYWTGDFAGALAAFLPLSESDAADTSFAALGRVYLALTVVALGDASRYDTADRLLQRVARVEKHGVPWDSYRRLAGGAVAAARGDEARARRVVAPLLTRRGIPVTHALLAELYRRMGEPTLALTALRLIDADARPGYAYVQSLTTAAALNAAAGQGARAHEQLERALEIAAENGVLAPFLGGGEVLEDLLDAHAHRGTRHEDLLHQVFAGRTALHGGADLLTPRERDVLAYLRTTMTAQEIAAALSLSLPTVKTHLASIYRKFGVGSRREAARISTGVPLDSPA